MSRTWRGIWKWKVEIGNLKNPCKGERQFAPTFQHFNSSWSFLRRQESHDFENLTEENMRKKQLMLLIFLILSNAIFF